MDLRKAPPTWEISSQTGVAMLRIGPRWLPLDEIVTLAHRPMAEVNGMGHLIAAGLFIGFGVLFIIPVAAGSSDFKLLIGALLFTVIGLTALSDLFRGQTYVLHRVEIGLANGRAEKFASVSEDDCLNLIDAIEAERGTALT